MAVKKEDLLAAFAIAGYTVGAETNAELKTFNPEDKYFGLLAFARANGVIGNGDGETPDPSEKAQGDEDSETPSEVETPEEAGTEPVQTESVKLVLVEFLGNVKHDGDRFEAGDKAKIDEISARELFFAGALAYLEPETARVMEDEKAEIEAQNEEEIKTLRDIAENDTPIKK